MNETDRATRMASSTIYSPSLVVVSGYEVATWKCMENDSKPVVLYPSAETPIADVTWNHNAQGKSVMDGWMDG